MTARECLDDWLEQYDEFVNDFNNVLKIHYEFQEVVKALSKKYQIDWVSDKVDRYEKFRLEKYGHDMLITIHIDKNDNIVLLDIIECGLVPIVAFKCTVAELHNSQYRANFEKEYEDYFSERSYFIGVENSKDESFHIIEQYESPRNALIAARKEQRELAASSFDLLRIGLFQGKEINEFYGYYSFSNKTKGETQRAFRKEFEYDMMNEYLETIPNPNNMNENVKKYGRDTIVIMTVIKLDEDGNLDYEMNRYSSKETARKEAEKIVNEWMAENNFTFDEIEVKRNPWHYFLCEKYDDENLIEVHCVQNISELNVLFKEFEI